jgi:RNA polymerase sigma factor (TIGR02999 family)
VPIFGLPIVDRDCRLSIEIAECRSRLPIAECRSRLPIADRLQIGLPRQVTREPAENLLTRRLTQATSRAQDWPDQGTKLDNPDVTALLRAWSDGNLAARDRLMAAVYSELHRRAAAYLRREPGDHTLQPTALVNEAYLRLVKQDHIVWQNRAQFYGIAAQMMRRILVDHARGGRMQKRSGRWIRVILHDGVAVADEFDPTILDLDNALKTRVPIGN